MRPELKLLGRKFKDLPIFDEYSGWYMLFVVSLFMVAIVGAIALIYYTQWLPANIDSNERFDRVNNYGCADLNDWLKINWAHSWFDSFHNKWVMNC